MGLLVDDLGVHCNGLGIAPVTPNKVKGMEGETVTLPVQSKVDLDKVIAVTWSRVIDESGRERVAVYMYSVASKGYALKPLQGRASLNMDGSLRIDDAKLSDEGLYVMTQLMDNIGQTEEYVKLIIIDQAGHCLCGREMCNEDDELCSTCEKACAVVECADDGNLSPTVTMLLKPHECSVCRERFADGCALTAHSATHRSSSGTRIEPRSLTVAQMRKELGLRTGGPYPHQWPSVCPAGRVSLTMGVCVGSGQSSAVRGKDDLALHEFCDSTGASCIGSAFLAGFAFLLDHTGGVERGGLLRGKQSVPQISLLFPG
ncbi:hypothetical protein Bbelb_378020 [Branchiostoma belcheri]|nr:hypothetical protein Bbelb_378020 [Branchiostoma belcheri]